MNIINVLSDKRKNIRQQLKFRAVKLSANLNNDLSSYNKCG